MFKVNVQILRNNYLIIPLTYYVTHEENQVQRLLIHQLVMLKSKIYGQITVYVKKKKIYET